MRDAANMPKLQKHPPTGRVHGVSDAFPAGDLLSAVDTGRAWIADPLWRDLCGFADDQSSAGTLGIIGGIERPRYIAAAGAIARHRRHHNAIGQLQRTELEW